MTVQGESTRITLLVTQTLERLGMPYAVGGSLASSLHGVMRSTLDVLRQHIVGLGFIHSLLHASFSHPWVSAAI